MHLPHQFRPTAADLERWGRRALLAAFVVLLLIDFLLGLSAAATGTHAGRPEAWVDYGALVVLDLTMVYLVFHRGPAWRRCVTAAAVSLVSSVVLVQLPGGGGAGLVEQAALGRLLLLGVRTLPPVRAGCAAFLLVAAMIAEPLRWEVVQDDILAVFFGLVALLVVAAGLYLRGLDNRRSRAVVDVRRAERLQLARELHDFVAHHVTGIVVSAQAAQMMATKDPQRALAALSGIEAAGMETLASMRRLVGMMRETDEGAGTLPGADAGALRELVNGFAKAGPPVRFRTDETLDHVQPEVATSAYRIVLEALTNVRRHGTGVRQVEVDVRRSAAGLLVLVRDDGRGGGAAPRGGSGGGFGLIGLAERAEAVGGRLTAGPHTGGGWEVTALLPITEPAT